MLAQKDNIGKERAIYYISKTLIDYETRYTPIGIMCFTIIFLIEKLRHYMLVNITFIIAQVDPFIYLILKP